MTSVYLSSSLLKFAGDHFFILQNPSVSTKTLCSECESSSPDLNFQKAPNLPRSRLNWRSCLFRTVGSQRRRRHVTVVELSCLMTLGHPMSNSVQ